MTIALLLLAFILFWVAEIIYIQNTGGVVPAPQIPRNTETLGSGPALSYLVMGDSTSIGQGADYKDSFAVASANHLAQNHTVKFTNVGISGATTETVARDQLKKAVAYNADVVLLSVGGNDARKFARGSVVQKSLQQIVDGLKAANCNVKIVVTRSPAMDSVSRFPHGAKELMRFRTYQVNKAFQPLIDKNNLTIAPIAETTRKAFLKDNTLTAIDKFHPNARGYALWTPIINQALDEALAKPDSCQK